MAFTAQELALKEEFDRFLADSGYCYYPDPELVGKTIRALAARKRELGRPYCTCRLVTGNAEIDEAIVCPCRFVDEEITAHGHCHCLLFASGSFSPDQG